MYVLYVYIEVTWEENAKKDDFFLDWLYFNKHIFSGMEITTFFAEDKAESSLKMCYFENSEHAEVRDSIQEETWGIPIQTCDQFGKLQLSQT